MKGWIAMSQIVVDHQQQFCWIFTDWPSHKPFMVIVDVTPMVVTDGSTVLVVNLWNSSFPDFVSLSALADPIPSSHGEYLDLRAQNLALVATVDDAERFVLFSLFEDQGQLPGVVIIETGEIFNGSILIGQIQWTPGQCW